MILKSSQNNKFAEKPCRHSGLCLVLHNVGIICHHLYRTPLKHGQAVNQHCSTFQKAILSFVPFGMLLCIIYHCLYIVFFYCVLLYQLLYYTRTNASRQMLLWETRWNYFISSHSTVMVWNITSWTATCPWHNWQSFLSSSWVDKPVFVFHSMRQYQYLCMIIDTCWTFCVFTAMCFCLFGVMTPPTCHSSLPVVIIPILCSSVLCLL